MPIYLQHGNLIDYVPPTDTSTEDVVFMGGLVGIPQAFIQAGELGALSVDGVYIFNKKDGVSVNLGDVVKYCGTTKFAQDSNADLTLGVAVADADADDYGVKVKINSVLPSSGGGGGGGGEVPVSCGLAFNSDGELIVATSCGLNFNSDGELMVKVARGCGIAFDDYGYLYATGGGGGGGGEVAVCNASGLYLNDNGEVAINYCGNSAIKGDTNGVYLAVCTASGLSIQNGELVASGGGGGDGLQNLATGEGSLSILGDATTSNYSVTIGLYAYASGSSIAIGNGAMGASNSTTAIGAEAVANGTYSTSLGYLSGANGSHSTALGYFTNASASYSTALGFKATSSEKGVTAISAWDDNGTTKTQLYLIGAGSTMSTTYCDGEAGLGFMSKDSSGNILKRGTIKLSAIMTENTNTFNPNA